MRLLMVVAACLEAASVCGQIGPLDESLVRMGATLRYKIGRRTIDRREKQICYDLVGCFPADRPLKKGPQSPTEVQTQFRLYTRNSSSELMAYGDDRSSLSKSGFSPYRPTKVIVHGFKGSGKDKGAKLIIASLLDVDDYNVMMLDWEKGAAGPSYRLSAANTQLVGRQLALVLFDLISIGALPSSIHVIGFSLGAHIAGYAGRELLRRGIRLGRITALDPASPLFREQVAATSLLSLNNQDAAFVDVVHTDGAILWTEGFGLLKAIGHVDFFPNGGQDQPGCSHVFASVLLSHLEGTVNSSTVCNHIRGFQLFLESLPKPQAGPHNCQFRAWPCPSRESFRLGNCFPSSCDINSTDGSCGLMGYEANKGLARGPLYLVTRDSPPFCGDQLQATVVLSRPARGPASLILEHGTSTTVFQLVTEWAEAAARQARQLVLGRRMAAFGAGVTYKGLTAADFGSTNVTTMSAKIYFRPSAGRDRSLLFYVRIASLDGQSWSYCGREKAAEPTDQRDLAMAVVQLNLGSC
ncbi:Lipase [Nesidiocoris tenuis]|uniref:Lipase n=1 Tax=Nesidiocoris tenuis TaxID=355587 RepID=A0ABN7B913_9HEMI|nr:Lipase [Nesidiocoris tenuis]